MNIKFWHIVSILASLTGTIICLLKIIAQERLGLDDSQVVHPGIATQEVYDTWDRYKTFVKSRYAKYGLFYKGLLLIVIGAIIEIVLVLVK